MEKSSKLELNIALLPEARLAQSLVRVSRDIASRYHTIVQLGEAGLRLTLAPHITLYQAPVPFENMSALDEALDQIVHNEQRHTLTSTGLAYNKAEGSIEDRKAVTDRLVALQARTIAQVNPLRNGLLLDRDPPGNVVAELSRESGRLGENIRATGYAEVGDPRTGGLFRPHDTLNWLPPGTEVDLAHEQSRLDQTDMSGHYEALGVFVMGPYGTCPQLIQRYELAA